MPPKYRMAAYILLFIDLYCQLCKLSRKRGKQLSEMRNSEKFQTGNHLQNPGIILERGGVKEMF